MQLVIYPHSVEYIDQLIPYARNSRTHSEQQVRQIAESIKQFGFTNPILIDENKGVIAGHGRILGAMLLNITEVPCITLSGLTDIQKQAYIIADNKIALNAGWNNDLLAIELQQLEQAGFNLELTGFDHDELDAIINAANFKPTESDADPDAIPEVRPDPITKPGDVWILGNHRLMCADATSMDTVATLVNGQQVDMMITDPPYNVAYVGKTKDALKIQNDSMHDDTFRQFLRDAFTAADSVMKAGAVFYIWHADLEGYNFRGACQDTLWKVRQCLIWNKNSMVIGRQDYHWKHEPCLYGWKEGSGHLWASDRKQVTVLNFDRPSRSEEHPTMKPVALFEYQLLNNTKGGDIVLDPFGGSGTTMIAAEKNGRRSFLMEIDPIYCDVIIRRWQEYTSKEAVLESTGLKFNDIEQSIPKQS